MVQNTVKAVRVARKRSFKLRHSAKLTLTHPFRFHQPHLSKISHVEFYLSTQLTQFTGYLTL